MHLSELEVLGFRNLAAQQLVFPAQVTLLVGKNGQGKTSVLEAVFFLSQARSFRTHSLRELQSWGRPPEQVLRVSGEIETDAGSKHLSCEIAGNRRLVSLNGNKLERAADFYGQLRTVLFTPDDLQLIRGGPGIRRQFFDRILASVDSTYVDELVQVQRVLKHRNKVLQKQARTFSQLEGKGRSSEIEPWTALLVQYGRRVVARRAKLLEDLSGPFGRYYARLSGAENTGNTAGESVGLKYHSQFFQDALFSEEQLLGRYAETLIKDIHAERTGIGPHRDEVEFLLNTGNGEKNARGGASQGQARTMALALTFSALDYVWETTGDPPLVLLDDVESELDQERKSALFEILRSLGSQALLTSTAKPDGLSFAGITTIIVEKGILHQEGQS